MSDSYVNRRQVLSATGAAIVGGLVMSGSAAASDHGGASSFSTELSGDAEVPPVETNASGRATFEVSEDGSEVHFEVYIDCIRNVSQGHIHLGSEGENGPVVTWLYPQATREPETIEGLNRDFVLAEGTLTEDDLVGPFEGESLAALAEAMANGETYVNIHSEQNPGGEIRGQIEADEAVEDRVEEPAEEDEEEPEEPEEEPEEEPDDDEEGEEEEEDDEPVTTAGEASLSLGQLNVGPGVDWEDEYITIQNVGDNTVDFTGWTLQDRRGEGIINGTQDDPWEFPGIVVLEPGEEVQIFSGNGESTATEWYIGYGNHIWLQGGDTVIVEDANGDVALEESYESQESLIGSPLQLFRSLFA